MAGALLAAFLGVAQPDPDDGPASPGQSGGAPGNCRRIRPGSARHLRSRGPAVTLNPVKPSCGTRCQAELLPYGLVDGSGESWMGYPRPPLM